MKLMNDNIEASDNILFRKHLGFLTQDIKVKEEEMTDEVLEALLSLSELWEREDSCHGYRKNERSDIEGNRIFLARDKGVIMGYLFGHIEKAKNSSSVIAEDTPYFEVEELFVKPSYRDCKVGHRLFKTMERAGNLTKGEAPGIYRITGITDIPFQIVITGELQGEEFAAYRALTDKAAE